MQEQEKYNYCLEKEKGKRRQVNNFARIESGWELRLGLSFLIKNI